MAGVTGLEPAAFCVTGRRYNQLNYTPVGENLAHLNAISLFVSRKTLHLLKNLVELPHEDNEKNLYHWRQ